MKATIYDVAKEAGVSIATVSKVINNKGKISAETRSNILTIIERLDYNPSVIASALTGKKTYTLGLLVPDISNPFFAEISRFIEDQGYRHGYSLIMCGTDNKDDKVERYISLLLQKSVDGIVIATGIDRKEIIDQLLEKQMPLVLIAREMPRIAVNTVIVDDYAGGRMAAEHLLQLGHSRIAILAENMKVSSSRERLRGFQQVMADRDIPFNEELLRICDYNVESGRSKSLELFGGITAFAEGPTALFACNDMLAVGALQAAKIVGLSVPADLSIVSFDNTILSTVTNPLLTTIAQPTEEMGKIAVDLLVKEIEEGGGVLQRIVLRPELLVRESTAARH